MTNAINAIATWLIGDHAMVLAGWQWLLSIPVALLIMIAVGYIGGWIVICAIGKSMRW